MQTFSIADSKVFESIANGKKIYEGRTPDSRMATVSIDELIQFTNGERSCVVRIKGFEIFDSIEEMLQKIGVDKMLPHLSDFDSAVNVYKECRKMGGHSENGKTIAIGFELV